jgi:FBP C-terminal treble-clef zinc-finger
MTMEPLTEKDIRASFVNCSKGEAGRVNLPRPLADVPWADLDFLGWRDPGAPDRGYVVTAGEGGPAGVALRGSTGVRRSFTKTTVCTLCMTGHPGTGVSLWVAARAGAAGRRANTVGAYICSDLACSLYLRGKKTTGLAARYEESLTLQEKVDRTLANLGAFLAKVRAA